MTGVQTCALPISFPNMPLVRVTGTPFLYIAIPNSSSKMAKMTKRKNLAAAYGSAAILRDLSLLFGPEVLTNESRSIDSPQNTCAIGSPVSEGLIVIHNEGGPFITHMPFICPRIFTCDSSVPITFDLSAVNWPLNALTIGFEKGTFRISSAPAINKSLGVNDGKAS